MSDPAALVGLRVLGVDVDIRVRGDEPGPVVGALRERWHLCLREDGGSGALPVVVDVAHLDGPPPAAADAWRDEGVLLMDEDLPRLLQRLTQAITHAAIAARTGELLMLHAAALADPGTGASAVFVAPGNTGKTTLCRALGPGRAYLTDETVGIRRDGSIEAYPKPLSLRRDDRSGVKDETAPGALGLAPPEASPWLAGIVLLDRDPDHLGPPRVESLGLLDAVGALAPESSGFMGTHRPLQWLGAVLTRTGGARRVTCSDVRDLEAMVAETCDRRSPW